MKQQRINEIVGFVYLAIGILILVSLLTHDPDDLSIFASTPNPHMHNFVGIIGAYISSFLYFIIGKSAYVIPFLCLVWAVSKFSSEEEEVIRKSYIKIAGTTVLFLAASSLLALIFNGTDSDMMAAGGITGMLASSVLDKYCGTVGAYIILSTLLVLSMLLATEFLIIPFITTIFAKTKEALLKEGTEIDQAGRRTPQINIKNQQRAAKEKVQRDRSTPIIKEAKKPEPIAREPKPVAQPPRIKVPNKPEVKVTAKATQSAEPAISPKPKVVGEYKLPTLDLLESPPPVGERQIKEDLTALSAVLEETLADFGIQVKVTQVEKGPVITRYELEPAAGVKVNKITALNDDIALAMKAQSVRIIAPIPGKSRVGIEVPNTTASLVYLKEVISSREFQDSESKLTLALGKDTAGSAVICELAKMPHLLIAGTTGAGKTVCVNSIILSMLYNASPDELKLILVDPKMVEMAMFNSLPHLICPVLTDAKKVSGALAWLVSEMESRYKLLAKAGARNILAFNQKAKEGKFKDDPQMPELMPYIVLVIDELADLMAVSSSEIENAITRLAQLSRAVGIHIILATQRPSVDVITGVIKANFPARISFKVASKVDSRTVLDMNGADKLLGKGDMLFMEPGVAKPTRAQSSLVSDKEIEKIIEFISSQRSVEHNDEIAKEQNKKSFGKAHEKDVLYDDAVKMIMETGQASVSMLQRRMRLSYTRAARLIDSMEEEGLLGPYCGSKPREILVDRDQYLEDGTIGGNDDV